MNWSQGSDAHFSSQLRKLELEGPGRSAPFDDQNTFLRSANLASFRFKRVLHKCPKWFREDAAEPQPA